MDPQLEEIVFELIANSGEARSCAMEAIRWAKAGNKEKALQSIEEAEAKLTLAHKQQTGLIQKEAGGQKVETSLLLIHAQDHFMNASTVKTLASEFIALYETIYEGSKL